MSKIDKLTVALCDELMLEAANGNLENIRETVMMLIKYASCELSRRGNKPASASLDCIANQFEEIFPRTNEHLASSKLAQSF